MSFRVCYYDKVKKKNVYKYASVKKFGGDEKATLEFLHKWKADKHILDTYKKIRTERLIATPKKLPNSPNNYTNDGYA